MVFLKWIIEIERLASGHVGKDHGTVLCDMHQHMSLAQKCLIRT